jgi:hypothetical protein
MNYIFVLMQAIPMFLGTVKNKVVSVKHKLIYSLITIRLATCFDFVGSSPGLHYEPINPLKPNGYVMHQQA